jgi:ABC-type sugar transport system substrate-binding protein
MVDSCYARAAGVAGDVGHREEGALAQKLALFLVDQKNEFQRLLVADAEAAAARHGLALECHFSGMDFAGQLATVQDCLDAAEKPSALLVMCVSDRGIQRLAQRAAHAGVHVLFVNASEDDLAQVRAENPKIAIGFVCPDEHETGRIQGRQFRRLVPARGKVLYVQGRVRSKAARDRTEGVQQALEGSPIELMALEAGWTADDGREAVGMWLRMALRANRTLDLIGCQNDMIAEGALEALSAVAQEFGRPEIRRIPVTGCDGSPEFGQPMVRRGELRATVVLPRSTGPAVDAIARTLRTGELPPPSLLLRPASYPFEDELRPELKVDTASLPGRTPSLSAWPTNPRRVGSNGNS